MLLTVKVQVKKWTIVGFIHAQKASEFKGIVKQAGATCSHLYACLVQFGRSRELLPAIDIWIM